MIQTNELRIGNLIIAKNIEVVKGIGLNGYVWVSENRNIDVMLCQGILLTEEWLLEFGFKYNQLSSEYIGNNMILFNRIDYVTWGTTKLYYVHQLQNLYFALTQEELTLTDNV